MDTPPIDRLIDLVQQEAQRDDFPRDLPVYKQAGKDLSRPVLFAGSLNAPVCVFGRDLGKQEVEMGEPLIGAGGRLVREGIYKALQIPVPPKSDRRLELALKHALLTNTVPFKPPGNKAYATSVKERFRPFLAELLIAHWTGRHLITLGTEAFQWFATYADAAAVQTFWAREDRYEANFDCVLQGRSGQDLPSKPIVLMPLPHPSPLNQRWYKRFPELLANRLSSLPLRAE